MSRLINNLKRKGFFEGWYFKQQTGDQIISFIPGFHTDAYGNSHAFLQIIMNDRSYSIPFSIKDFSVDRKRYLIRLGNNSFGNRGVKVNIKTGDISIKGKLKFGKISPIRYTIMGYFKYFPLMECKHEILSMYHKVYGDITCNGKKYSFRPGIGYAEKDMGYSFPKSYLWIQCNRFFREKCSVFVSIADIPYHGIHFKGCICVIQYQGREYRLATYLGVKILNGGPGEVCLKQGRYLFKIDLYHKQALESPENASQKSREFSHELYAPFKGDMVKTIKEQHLADGRFLLYDRERLIFDLTSREVSYEYVE